jgi:hypothetical protein
VAQAATLVVVAVQVVIARQALFQSAQVSQSQSAQVAQVARAQLVLTAQTQYFLASLQQAAALVIAQTLA